jgi:signal transduction histidine kinase
MTMYRNFKEIQLNKFFAGANESVIDTHFKPECFKDVNEGDILYQSGDSADYLYLLLRGDVKIKFPSNNYISSKIFNDFFGEKEIIDASRRVSSAIANSKCLLYLIDEKTFNALISKSEIIKNNIDNYGDVENPEAESVSDGGLGSGDISELISSDEQNSPEEEQSNIVTKEFESNTESISHSISEIIEEEFSDIELKLEDDNKNLNKDSNDENISPDVELDGNKEIKIEQPSEEELEQSIEEPHIEQMLEEEKQDASINISKFISENISTPVDVINRYTLLLHSEGFSEKVKDIILMIQKQANFFPDIIRTAFDYNKSDFELKLKSFSLNSYLNSISELLSEYCESRNINLFKKIGEDVKVKIDPGKLYMALYQVIKNGCDAMEINGNLYISTEKEGLLANIIIRDEGPGIPNDNRDEIFETVFSESKGRNKIGLAITKRIIELHNGQVKFSSKLKEGTTFTFSIPISQDAELMPQFDHSPFDNDDADDFEFDEETNSDT